MFTTKEDQIADVFYVRDLEWQKVEDGEQIEKIRQSLVYQLTPPKSVFHE